MYFPPPPQLLPPVNPWRSSIYAGDLHPDTTDVDLYRLFSMIGPVYAIQTYRKSTCYAYITFYIRFHAKEALRHLNHTELRGKPMRLQWWELNPLTRINPEANLFVKNLSRFVECEKLERVFGKFGEITSCKIATDDVGNNMGFAYIQMDSEEAAVNAQISLDGTEFEGKIISVAKFLQKNERKEAEARICVKNLDPQVTEIQLREIFSQYGKIDTPMIVTDARGKPKGFAFLDFESMDCANQAIAALNGTLIGSKKLFVGKAIKRSGKEESKLFVKHLAPFVDEKALEKTFSDFGDVVMTKVIRHESGISKGFGFVTFSNAQEANKARHSLNGTNYHGKILSIYSAWSKVECARKLNPGFAPQHQATYQYDNTFNHITAKINHLITVSNHLMEHLSLTKTELELQNSNSF